jgi:hypothetical protein
LQHAVQVFVHLIIPEAKDLEARLLQFCCPVIVGQVVGMLTAVQFHDQTRLMRQEIGDVVQDWGLTSEFDAQLLVA